MFLRVSSGWLACEKVIDEHKRAERFGVENVTVPNWLIWRHKHMKEPTIWPCRNTRKLEISLHRILSCTADWTVSSLFGKIIPMKLFASVLFISKLQINNFLSAKTSLRSCTNSNSNTIYLTANTSKKDNVRMRTMTNVCTRCEKTKCEAIKEYPFFPMEIGKYHHLLLFLTVIYQRN